MFEFVVTATNFDRNSALNRHMPNASSPMPQAAVDAPLS